MCVYIFGVLDLYQYMYMKFNIQVSKFLAAHVKNMREPHRILKKLIARYIL